MRAFESIRHRTSLALRLNIFVLLPASVGLAILGVPIVAVLFERGQFGAPSVQETAYALTFFSLGLAGQAATALLVRVFYALQDVMTPLRISLIVIAVNLATNVVLVRLLQQGGLALGTSIAATLNAVLLGRALRGRLHGLEGRAILRTMGRAVAGVVPMAAIVALTIYLLTHFSAEAGWRQLAAVLAAVAAGAVVYLVVQMALRSEEVGVALSVIKREQPRV
jgi:putative peptidoglycan lipid II flippase